MENAWCKRRGNTKQRGTIIRWYPSSSGIFRKSGKNPWKSQRKIVNFSSILAKFSNILQNPEISPTYSRILVKKVWKFRVWSCAKVGIPSEKTWKNHPRKSQRQNWANVGSTNRIREKLFETSAKHHSSPQTRRCKRWNPIGKQCGTDRVQNCANLVE